MLSTATIKRNLISKIYQTKDIRDAFEASKRKFQSVVWNTFLAILDDKNEVISSHVCCKYCSDVFKCTVIQSENKNIGTSNLLRHSTGCRSKMEANSKKKNGNGRF